MVEGIRESLLKPINIIIYIKLNRVIIFLLEPPLWRVLIDYTYIIIRIINSLVFTI